MADSIFDRQAKVLDVMEELQRQGVGQLIDLPRMVICGEQSSGKSSVLEALSTIPFPTDDGLCTRFPTELVLRRGKKNCAILITPSSSRSDIEREALSKFSHTTFHPDKFGDVVNEAKLRMGIKDGTSFVDDILRVEITDPSVPNLTVIDLPGIFHSRAPGQTKEDGIFVVSMVKRYMEAPRTIILAVMSAKADMASQQVLEYAAEFDDKFERTMGLLTKPDMLEANSKNKSDCLKLVTNQYEEYQLKLGWYIVKNRSFAEKHTTLTQRNQSEKEFLTKLWPDEVPPDRKGIESLRTGLAAILYEAVVSSIPSVLEDAEKATKMYHDKIKQLEATPVDSGKVTTNLFMITFEFQKKLNEIQQGKRLTPKSNPRETSEPFDLRQKITKCLTRFADTMKRKGHQYQTQRPKNAMVEVEQSGITSYATLTQIVEDMINATEDIPGHVSPTLVSALFYDQSSSWLRYINEMKEDVLAAVRDCVVAIVEEFCMEKVKTCGPLFIESIIDLVIGPKLQLLKAELDARQEDCLYGHATREVIDIGPAVTERIPDAWKEEWAHYLANQLNKLGINNKHTHNHKSLQHFDMSKLVDALTTDLDIVAFTRAETIACMAAHYEEELNKVLHKFDISSVYRHALKHVEEMFSMENISAIVQNPERLSQFRGLGEGYSVEIADLQQKIKTMKEAIKRLTELQNEDQAEVLPEVKSIEMKTGNDTIICAPDSPSPTKRRSEFQTPVREIARASSVGTSAKRRKR